MINSHVPRHYFPTPKVQATDFQLCLELMSLRRDILNFKVCVVLLGFAKKALPTLEAPNLKGPDGHRSARNLPSCTVAQTKNSITISIRAASVRPRTSFPRVRTSVESKGYFLVSAP